MTHHILAIDDEKPNLMMLEEYLSDDDYELVTVQSAKEGIAHLESGKKVHAILLDRMMPEMNGMEFMAFIKGHERFKHIPVIMQTAAASQDQIAEGITAGVFYYLTKPYKKNLLLSVLKHALKDFSVYDDLRARMEKTNAALTRLDDCSFSFQSLDDVTNISFYVAQLYPDAEEVIMGIKELMLNAVEHGNLGITYEEKTELNNKGAWVDEVNQRLLLAENKHKFAKAVLKKMPQEIVFVLEDQGKGFDWEKYLQMSPERALHNHGRGIAMSKMMSFDSMEYIAPGNKVICTKKIGH